MEFHTNLFNIYYQVYFWRSSGSLVRVLRLSIVPQYQLQSGACKAEQSILMRRLYQFRDTYSHMCCACVCEVEYIVEAYAPTEIWVLVRISHDLRVSIVEILNRRTIDKLNRHLSMGQWNTKAAQARVIQLAVKIRNWCDVVRVLFSQKQASYSRKLLTTLCARGERGRGKYGSWWGRLVAIKRR